MDARVELHIQREAGLVMCIYSFISVVLSASW